MKKQIGLKHILSFIAHQPFYGWHDDGHKCVIDIQMLAKHGAGLANYKPILRPLSDLTKEITHNGETFVPSEKLVETDSLACEFYAKCGSEDPSRIPYGLFCLLTEWYFDVFDLIPSGLAIDINTLNEQK